MKRILYILLLALLPLAAGAQFVYTMAPNVLSPKMELNGQWDALPVMTLGSDDVMCFSFDEMSHAYHRFTYRITHCNSDWTPSDMHEIEFLDGFNDIPVEEWENSVNTLRLYTHYRFTLPNENVSLVLSGNYKKNFDDVCKNLEMLRYKGGVRNGYPSRLHYTSWWIADNMTKGIIEEVTGHTKHETQILELDFMSTHPDSYPLLKEDYAMRAQIAELEKPFQGIATNYIPKSLLNKGKEVLEIRNGDIIALVTTVKGLDISHVGFAYWNDGTLHLLHASSGKGKVIKDTVTLFNYQKNRNKQIGIRVLRLK